MRFKVHIYLGRVFTDDLNRTNQHCNLRSTISFNLRNCISNHLSTHLICNVKKTSRLSNLEGFPMSYFLDWRIHYPNLTEISIFVEVQENHFLVVMVVIVVSGFAF